MASGRTSSPTPPLPALAARVSKSCPTLLGLPCVAQFRQRMNGQSEPVYEAPADPVGVRSLNRKKPVPKSVPSVFNPNACKAC